MPYGHATRFAGLPVVEVPKSGAQPPLDPTVAWRFAYNKYDGGMAYGPLAEYEAAFDTFLTAAGAELTALVVGPWGYAAFNDAPIAQLCAAAPRLPNLRALFLGDMTSEECEISWMRVGDVSPLLMAYPRLEVLRVRGGDLDFTPVRHDHLRELTVETGGLAGEMVGAVLASELPALTDLELWLGIDDYGGTTTLDDLAPLLAGGLFPRLRRLGLCNAEHADDIARALASAPLVPRLESLDLSLGTLGDEGAAALLAGQPLTHLDRLDLAHHYLSEEMAQRLEEALPDVLVDLSDPQEDDEDDGETYRYTAVGE